MTAAMPSLRPTTPVVPTTGRSVVASAAPPCSPTSPSTTNPGSRRGPARSRLVGGSRAGGDDLLRDLPQLDVAVRGEPLQEGERALVVEPGALHDDPDGLADQGAGAHRLAQVAHLLRVRDGLGRLVGDQRDERLHVVEGADPRGVEVEGPVRAAAVEEPHADLRADPLAHRHRTVLGEPLVGAEVGGDDEVLVDGGLVARTLLEPVLLAVDAEQALVGRRDGVQAPVGVTDGDAAELHVGQDLDRGSGDLSQRGVQVRGFQSLAEPAGGVDEALAGDGVPGGGRGAHRCRILVIAAAACASLIPARAAAMLSRSAAIATLTRWDSAITPIAMSIALLSRICWGALAASSRLRKGRSLLVTAPGAQAPHALARASWCPSKASTVEAYRFTLPRTTSLLMIGSESVEAMPAAAVACWNIRHCFSSRTSQEEDSTVSPACGASMQGPPSRYWTASSEAISVSLATRVKVRRSSRTARLSPTHSGTIAVTRRLISSSAVAASVSPYLASSSIVSRVSGTGSKGDRSSWFDIRTGVPRRVPVKLPADPP